MASLGAFANNIRRRARQVESGVDRVVAETAIVIDQAVVLSTPVKTGRARANWLPSLDAPILEATEETDKSGRDTIARSAAIINARQPGQTVYLTNNVHYIGLLNEGSSSQAPANFVLIAVNAGLAFLRSRRIII